MDIAVLWHLITLLWRPVIEHSYYTLLFRCLTTLLFWKADRSHTIVPLEWVLYHTKSASVSNSLVGLLVWWVRLILKFATLLQLHFELNDLTSQLVDSPLHFFRRTLDIDFAVQFYVFSTARKFECTYGLLQTWAVAAARYYHACSEVATKAFLQDSCQFAVSIWDMVTFVCEGVNDVSETTEWKIDLFSLLKCLPHCSCLGDLLAAC